MKLTICVFFMLCSGFFHFTSASNRLRLFHLNKTETKTLNDSLQYCKERSESAVTLFDEDDMEFTKKFVGEKCWLGLHRNRTTTWSNGVPVTFGNSSVYETDIGQTCVAIDNNKWTGLNCSERKPFMCYKGDSNILIEDKKNWCQALQYCRQHFFDLVSISDEWQNDEVIEDGKNTSFWIGLMHDKWEWLDKSCSSYREWKEKFSTYSDEKCTSYNKLLGEALSRFQCSSSLPSLCSKGMVRIKVVNEALIWPKAFEYCRKHHTRLLWIEDGEDQEALQQWLSTTLPVGPFWIGLKYSRVVGQWWWSSSDRPLWGFSKWKKGMEQELPVNHCGAINNDNGDGDWTWRDEDCRFPLKFICEENIVSMERKMHGLL